MSALHHLRGKVALVTAGSAGVGAAIARALACNAGMRVAINYNSRVERAQQLVRELEQLTRNATTHEDITPAHPSPRFMTIQADMGDRQAIYDMVKGVHSVMGQVHVVVSNAGWTRVRDFMNLDDNLDEDDWDRCFRVNVKSHLWLFHAVRSHLHQTAGTFICTASVAGVKPSGSSLPYAVTKAALIHLSQSLAVIAAPRVRVNSVSPGVLLTEWGLSFPQEKLDAVKESNRLKTFATVEDVAQQVLAFACSASATGQNAIIDAGFSL